MAEARVFAAVAGAARREAADAEVAEVTFCFALALEMGVVVEAEEVRR